MHFIKSKINIFKSLNLKKNKNSSEKIFYGKEEKF